MISQILNLQIFLTSAIPVSISTSWELSNLFISPLKIDSALFSRTQIINGKPNLVLYSSFMRFIFRLLTTESLSNPAEFCSKVDSLVKFPSSANFPAKSGWSRSIFNLAVKKISLNYLWIVNIKNLHSTLRTSKYLSNPLRRISKFENGDSALTKTPASGQHSTTFENMSWNSNVDNLFTSSNDNFVDLQNIIVLIFTFIFLFQINLKFNYSTNLLIILTFFVL